MYAGGFPVCQRFWFSQRVWCVPRIPRVPRSELCSTTGVKSATFRGRSKHQLTILRSYANVPIRTAPYTEPRIRTLFSNNTLSLMIPLSAVFFISIFLISRSKASFGVLKSRHFINLFRNLSSTKEKVSFGTLERSALFLTYLLIALFRFSTVPFSCGDCG